MVIRYFDVHRALTGPAEANTPLIVDTNTVLTSAIAAQGFEAVGRGQPEIRKLLRSNQSLKSHTRSALDVVRKATDDETTKQTLCVLALEPLYRKDRHLRKC